MVGELNAYVDQVFDRIRYRGVIKGLEQSNEP